MCMNIVIVVFYLFPKYYAGITPNVFNDPFYVGIQTLHKVFYHHDQLSPTIPPYYLPAAQSTTQYHPLHYNLATYSSTLAHKNNYFSRTLSDWNMLPIYLIEVGDSY